MKIRSNDHKFVEVENTSSIHVVKLVIVESSECRGMKREFHYGH